VVLSIGLGFIQEHRSTAAATKLATIVRIQASVTRTGEADHPPTPGHDAFFEIPLDQLAPGDTVHPPAGDMNPANVRLITAKDLYVNQSALTGEPMPV
jgi:Mg2+-importing ATPase